VLIYYDVSRITPIRITQEIMKLEEMRDQREVAATVDDLQKRSPSFNYNDETMPAFSSRNPSNIPSYSPNTGISPSPLPAPLALSVTGAGILGVGQLLYGKSSLARSPGLFNLSALVSVISGYPLIKRNYQKAVAETRINPDLLLGAAALGLALLRENIVVLAGLSLLELLKWKKSKIRFSPGKQVTIPPEIKEYSENTGRFGLLAAGTAWAVTANPFIGLSVLLAAIPVLQPCPPNTPGGKRPLSAREKGLLIPNVLLLPNAPYQNRHSRGYLPYRASTESEIQCTAEKMMWQKSGIWLLPS
jgi:hypothetical protein